MKFSGVTTYTPVEGSEQGALLTAFIEQLRSEKFGGAYSPLRLVYSGADVATEKEIAETCFVEDSNDINKEFPYSDFLCMLHKLIRN